MEGAGGGAGGDGGGRGRRGGVRPIRRHAAGVGTGTCEVWHHTAGAGPGTNRAVALLLSTSNILGPESSTAYEARDIGQLLQPAADAFLPPANAQIRSKTLIIMAASGTIHVAELAKSGRSTCKKVRRFALGRAPLCTSHFLRATSRAARPHKKSSSPAAVPSPHSATKKSRTKRSASASRTTTATV